MHSRLQSGPGGRDYSLTGILNPPYTREARVIAQKNKNNILLYLEYVESRRIIILMGMYD